MTDSSTSSGSSPAGQVVRREWRAPNRDGTAVIEPPWTELPGVIESNRRWFDTHAFAAEIECRAWRIAARREALEAAQRYTAELTGNAPTVTTTGPLIVDGHQPELFHPGVWAKNFAIHRLARRVGGTSLHLIVDNDLLAHTAIRVPAGSQGSPHFALEAFDQLPLPRPWEDARVADRALFASFAERVRERMRPWDIDPLAMQAWAAAMNWLRQSESLADALTVARVSVEQSWGVQNLELPVSRLSSTPSFHRFAALLMMRSADVLQHYNAVVREYRRINRVRNKAHPVPDLAIEGGWHEIPFRVWKVGDAHRQRPFLRPMSGGWELRDEHEVVTRWPDSVDAAQHAIADLANRGIRLRPRALTLTLFARLLLADLFVHGLGGAKYDEMTDALSIRLFGASPPPYLTVSATVLLPQPKMQLLSETTMTDIGAARHRLWQLDHNPQNFADSSNPSVAALIAEKSALIAASPANDRSTRRRNYRRLRKINAELAATLSEKRNELTRILHACERLRDENRVRLSREYSWLLFPETKLRSFYERTFPERIEGT